MSLRKGLKVHSPRSRGVCMLDLGALGRRIRLSRFLGVGVVVVGVECLRLLSLREELLWAVGYRVSVWFEGEGVCWWLCCRA